MRKFIFSIFLFISFIIGFSLAYSLNGKEDKKMNKKENIHHAYGAGRWFPANKNELYQMINGFINEAKVAPISNKIIAAIAPHAGFIYSGSVAGYTFRALQDQAKNGMMPETVVILGFCHRASFDGLALLSADAISTPLGETEIDKEGNAILTNNHKYIVMENAPHKGEHSAENEVPFVQVALPDAKLIIGLFGSHHKGVLEETVEALKELSSKKSIVVIASTDMLHDPDYDLVTRTDQDTLKKLAELKISEIAKEWNYARQTLCGLMPVLAAAQFAKSQGSKEGIVLKYRNTGDDFPESRGQWVVGYGSVVFTLPK